MRGHQRSATVVVANNCLLSEGAARLLLSANFRVIDAAPRAHKLIAKAELGRHLFLIIHAGDQFDATLSQVQLLRHRHPYERIAVVEDCYWPDQLVAAFRAGANGYFTSATDSDVFIKSIELVMMGEITFPSAFRSLLFVSDCINRSVSHQRSDPNQIRLRADARGGLLSPRESSILGCLVIGDSNKSIARKLKLAEATVKVHVKAILRKIRVQNCTQAAIWAVNQGGFDVPAVTSPHLSPATETGAGHQPGKPAAPEAIAPINHLEARALWSADCDLTLTKPNGNNVRLRKICK